MNTSAGVNDEVTRMVGSFIAERVVEEYSARCDRAPKQDSDGRRIFVERTFHRAVGEVQRRYGPVDPTTRMLAEKLCWLLYQDTRGLRRQIEGLIELLELVQSERSYQPAERVIKALSPFEEVSL